MEVRISPRIVKNAFLTDEENIILIIEIPITVHFDTV